MLNKLQFQNLAELQLQNLDQPLCSKSEKSLVLGPNVSSQICNKLLPTWSSLSTSAKVTTSTSFELASSHARVTSIRFAKRYGVSQWASQWVSDKHSQWSDSVPIKIFAKVAKNAKENLFFLTFSSSSLLLLLSFVIASMSWFNPWNFQFGLFFYTYGVYLHCGFEHSFISPHNK